MTLANIYIHQYLIMGKNCEKNSAESMWTFIKWSTLANSWVLTESLQYSLSPGLATNLWANSLWNISTAHLPKDKKINLLLNLFFYNYISDYNIHVHVYIYKVNGWTQLIRSPLSQYVVTYFKYLFLSISATAVARIFQHIHVPAYCNIRFEIFTKYKE